ncbi:MULTISPECIES: flagellar basal body-associated protein FliL [unclassified Helicobacter]|uniref:flagellar basal body-associated protein FliL n=1 Tax=unclassified Helicobacter TaxID=2593540 RepID=UPI000CF03844|nr:MULTISPECIES: flagellar basal body-associated protein FliL [unclassified Helicobacter]
MAEEKIEQEPKKSKALLFVIIGAVVFLIVVVALVAFLLLSGSEKNQENTQPEATQQKPGILSSKDANLLNLGPLYPIAKPFVVNLVTQNGRRYLKTSITLELSNPKLQAEIDQKTTVVQDIIIDILSSKSIEEIVTTKGKERIKDEILQRVNQILADGFIKNVFFTEFVVQ